MGHALAGESLTIGFDAYGYNYQAHLFNGSFANVYLGRVGFAAYDGDDDSYLAENSGAADHWAWPYRDIELNMKWNDAWLANTDCDGNGSLDRHSGSPTYIGSGAWLTNHMVGGTGSDTWTYSTKIVAAPADADNAGGIW